MQQQATFKEPFSSLKKVSLPSRQKGLSLDNRPDPNFEKVLQENEILKEEVMMLTTLLKDALPQINRLSEQYQKPGAEAEQSVTQQMEFTREDNNTVGECNASLLDEHKPYANESELLPQFLIQQESTLDERTTSSWHNVNAIYTMERRGNIKDLNRACKNFNFPLMREEAALEAVLEGKKRGEEVLKELDVEQLRQLKGVIDQWQSAGKGKYDSGTSGYEVISAKKFWSRNSKDPKKDYNSENFSGISDQTQDHIPPVNSHLSSKPGTITRTGHLHNPFSQFKQSQPRHLQDGPILRKEMFYPSPLTVTQNSTNFDCQQSLISSNSSARSCSSDGSVKVQSQRQSYGVGVQEAARETSGVERVVTTVDEKKDESIEAAVVTNSGNMIIKDDGDYFEEGDTQILRHTDNEFAHQIKEVNLDRSLKEGGTFQFMSYERFQNCSSMTANLFQDCLESSRCLPRKQQVLLLQDNSAIQAQASQTFLAEDYLHTIKRGSGVTKEENTASYEVIKGCGQQSFKNEKSMVSHTRSKSLNQRTYIEDDSMPRQQVLDVVQQEIPQIQKIPDSSRLQKSPVKEQMVMMEQTVIEQVEEEEKQLTQTPQQRHKSLSQYDLPRKKLTNKWCTLQHKERDLVALNRHCLDNLATTPSYLPNRYGFCDQILQKATPSDSMNEFTTQSHNNNNNELEEEEQKEMEQLEANLVSVRDIEGTYVVGEGQTMSPAQPKGSSEMYTPTVAKKCKYDTITPETKEEEQFTPQADCPQKIQIISKAIKVGSCSQQRKNRYQTMALELQKKRDKSADKAEEKKVQNNTAKFVGKDESLEKQISCNYVSTGQKSSVIKVSNYEYNTEDMKSSTSNADGKTKLEQLLDEFIRENLLSKNADQLRQELANFIYKPNVHNLFMKGVPSHSTSQSNIEQELPTNETPQPQLPPTDLVSYEQKYKVSPIRMKCNEVDQIIQEEASAEEESRLTLGKQRQSLNTLETIDNDIQRNEDVLEVVQEESVFEAEPIKIYVKEEAYPAKFGIIQSQITEKTPEKNHSLQDTQLSNLQDCIPTPQRNLITPTDPQRFIREADIIESHFINLASPSEFSGRQSKRESGAKIEVQSYRSRADSQYGTQQQKKRDENQTQVRIQQAKERREKLEREKSQRLLLRLDRKYGKSGSNFQNVTIDSSTHRSTNNHKSTERSGNTSSRVRTQSSVKKQLHIVFPSQFTFPQEQVQSQKEQQKQCQHLQLEEKLRDKEDKIKALLDKKKEQEEKIKQLRLQKEQQLSNLGKNSTLAASESKVIYATYSSSKPGSMNPSSTQNSGVCWGKEGSMADVCCNASNLTSFRESDRQNQSGPSVKNLKSGRTGSKPRKVCIKQQEMAKFDLSTVGNHTARIPQFSSSHVFSPVKSNQPTQREVLLLKKIERDNQFRRAARNNGQKENADVKE